MYFIVIRQHRTEDIPAITELVRNCYTSNISSIWLNALFREITFQVIVILSAIMFIIFGVPLLYCITAIPLVLIMMYLIIYGANLMKSAEVMHSKRHLECWLAEAFEPFFFTKDPESCWYKVITEDEMESEGIKADKFQRKVIGTVAVMRHSLREDWAWLFRLAVDKRYRRKGIGLKLVEAVKKWSHYHQYNNVELVMSECQEEARHLFNDAGFEFQQLYNKNIFTSALTLQMFQLRCEVRPTF